MAVMKKLTWYPQQKIKLKEWFLLRLSGDLSNFSFSSKDATAKVKTVKLGEMDRSAFTRVYMPVRSIDA